MIARRIDEATFTPPPDKTGQTNSRKSPLNP
jgi:hypothetical protein